MGKVSISVARKLGEFVKNSRSKPCEYNVVWLRMRVGVDGKFVNTPRKTWECGKCVIVNMPKSRSWQNSASEELARELRRSIVWLAEPCCSVLLPTANALVCHRLLGILIMKLFHSNCHRPKDIGDHMRRKDGKGCVDVKTNWFNESAVIRATKPCFRWLAILASTAAGRPCPLGHDQRKIGLNWPIGIYWSNWFYNYWY
jgi:hypothetical protein